jgi:PAS domain S-box-containing protein
LRSKPDLSRDFHASLLSDENTQRLLKIFIALALGGSIVYLATANILVKDGALRSAGVIAAFCSTLGAFVLLRRNRTGPAAQFLVWGIWLSLLLQVFISNGMLSRSLMAMPIVIVLAGWLLPARNAVVLCIATILGGLALALAERAGLLPLFVSPSPPLLVWLAFTIYIVLAATVAYHIFRGFRLRHEALRTLGIELSQQVETLSAREAELHLLMESVPAMIFHGDRDKRCIFANRSYAEFYASADHRPIGLTVREIVGEAAYRGVDERLDRVLAGERLAYRGTRKSSRGEEAVLDIELLPEPDGKGGTRGFFAVINNVTVQVLAEAELRRSEEKFAKVFRFSPLAVAITRLADGCYLDVNESWSRLFGWSREEAVGRTSLEMGKWVNGEERLTWAAALKRGGHVANMEVRFRTKAGAVRHVLLSSELIDLGGEACALVMVADISDRKAAEQALRESEARLREAQRIGRIGSWEMDLASNRLRWSDEIYMMFERAPETFGSTFEAFLETVHPDDLPALREAYRKSVHVKGAYEVDHRILTPGGRVKYVREHWEIFCDETNKPVRSVGTIHDITEQVLARKEIQSLNDELETRVRERTAELQAANKELESFAYSISHDLRAPLRGIDGFSHLLAEEYADRLDEQGRGYLDRVRRAAQRMGTLIDDILELSRVTRLGMRRNSVDLSALAREILDERARGAPEHSVRIVLASDCIAFGDPQLLRVLMQNLLENAWKYSAREHAPKIEFGCASENGERVFYVRDNGVGFDMQYADRLFSPFQRLHKPEEFEGTGIGLATVARVVHRHGGRVWAESAVGQGALFRFTLGEHRSAQ